MSNLHDAAIPVRRYVETYGLRSFIETGCYAGDGLRFADRCALELFSCDLNSGYVERCRGLFPNAHLYNTDSSTFLRGVCPQIGTPSLFWLDAHFPRHHGRESERWWPLFADLQTVKELKPQVERDVILCDDILVIGGEDNPRYRPGECEHIDTRHALPDYVAIFSDTHHVDLINEETGVLAFLPK